MATPRTSARRGGAPVGLTREAILAAADTFDVDHLSMPRLAKVLGVSHAALYHWFPNKQALIAALVESSLQDVVLPAPQGPWRKQVTAAAATLRGVILSRSAHLPHLAASASAAGSPLIERILEALNLGGLPEREAVQVTELISAWAFYSAWQAAFIDGHDLQSASSLHSFLDETGVGDESRLRDVIVRYTQNSSEELFVQNLDLLLDRFDASGPKVGRSK